MVRKRPDGWGVLGTGVGSQMRQALLRRSPAQCSIVPSHDPVRITVGYNQYPKQGYIVTVDAGYGLKVVRDNMCQLFTIAE